MRYRLQSLLALREEAEAAAERRLAEALAARQAAEAETARLAALAERAHERHAQERAERAATSSTSIDEGLATIRYLERLAAEAKACDTATAAYRAGPLAKAVSAEEDARARHQAARIARESLTKHKAKVEEETRIVRERRAEDAASDLALSAYARREPGS